MKISVIITAVAVVTAGILFLAFAPSSSSQTQTAQPTKSSQITNEVTTGVAVLLDVRTPQEFNDGHSAQAINFDSTRIKQGEMPNLQKDTKIYLYCRSGNRATQVKQALESNGFQNIENLGGLSQMQSLGLL